MQNPAAKPGEGLLRPFYPALDGLRAVAFLLVFAFHIHPRHAPWSWGWVGVDLFFALSGFLITGILFDSLHRSDYFRSFYIRRALRIFPLFYGFWILLLLLTPVLHIAWNRYLVSMVFYVGNFFAPGGTLGLHPDPGAILFHPVWAHGTPRVVNVGHLWSLCVEEQFYLAWPAAVWLIRSRTSLLRLCLGLLAAFPLVRFAYLLAWPQMVPVGGLYFNTFTRMDTLLAGAALALWIRGPMTATRTVHRLAPAVALGAPLLLGLLVCLEKAPRVLPNFDPVVSTVGFTMIAAAAAAVLLLAIQPSSWLIAALRWRPLVSMGRISYGMYFFHQLVFVRVIRNPRLAQYHLALPLPLLLFVLIYAVSWLSFRFLESPFLRLKPLLAPRPGAADDPPPSGAPTMLLPGGAHGP